ncbi:hypothetical protein TREMEDRAFT_46096 [Tremella mesenterica DSM 1558]|nr:uncharacterized protein TREMEDRAFT_46096 [Tremella mesenterica DSM 1558]EIW65869.1 hypothetical protein TREMEDRAFT_46096 [Tremella mesenterica DSM 1558]
MVMDHVFNGTFNARSKYIDWVKEAQDGTFSHQDEHGNIVLSTVDSMNISSVLVNASLVLDSTGHRLYWNSFSLSADMQYVLLRTDYVKQWRYSSHANYWIHRLSDSSSFPLLTPTDPPTTAYAKWSPVSHSIAYVSNNDLYVIRANELGPGMKSIRVTDDGSASVFNGVPDWVYEEEVLSGDYALWWSPDAQSIAYLRSDESAVHDYTIQYYNPTNDAFTVHQYLSEMDMKYPKPGTPNPLVTVHTFSLATYQTTNSVEQAKKMLHWKGEMPVESRIISEVAWVAQDALLVKEIDRAARVGNVVLFQYGETDGKVVRTLGANGEEGEGGWIDHDQNVIPVANGQSGYLDIVPKDGYNHIALFSPLQSGEPIWLTEGEWEVTSIAGFDPLNNLVYFVAANPSIDRHLHSAVLPTSGYGDFNPQIVALTDTSQPGYYDVLFSPGARYYLLSYKGPEVPWQRLMETGEEGVNVLMEGNAELNVTLAEFMRPIVTRTTIESDGYELNMQIMTPPNFDTSGRKKYPVLIRVYGGPGSQMVNNMWGRDWHTYLACEKKYIIVLVDGRGTGFKGRKLRNPVTDDLGRWEVVDQVAGAREMAKRVYVDRTRIGIWGWSYGGYMTCKTVEADSGIFTLGMAVAPVTDWMYYDSIYTERYMSTPEQNPEGYHSSAVNNMTAFGKVDFLLAHGSGDDNVHFMNSATLLDKLTQSGINGWRFRMFTDSNHSMDKRNGYRQVFEWMNVFLEEKWGKGGTVHH